MVEFNRVQCLRHPVSVAYLKQKWQSYGRVLHAFNLLFFLMSLIPLTYIVSNVDSNPHFESYANLTDLSNSSATDRFTTFQTAMMIQLTVVNILQMIKELVQMYQQKLSYFLDATNYVEWTLYMCSVLYVMPFLTGYPIHWQFEVGALAVFLAWFNLLVFLQKFDIAGIYVVMFMQILKTLVHVLLVFIFLIIAFALAFTVLMQNEEDKAFKTPWLSILRVSTMFLGEIGYLEKFLEPYVDGDPNTFHFAFPTFLLLLAFILMMPILLMNLLIGLAVGDIAEVQSNAVLQRLAMQVRLHTAIEEKLPAFFLEKVDKSYVTIFPNRCSGITRKLWDEVFKYTGIQENYGENCDPGSDPYIDYIQSELLKQKSRIKKMQTTLDKQHELLRLIVQKMEIHSEADNQDEGSLHNADMKPRKSLSSLSKKASNKLLALQAFKSKKL